MPIVLFEGIVENGQIWLRDHVTLCENAKVYAVLPDIEAAPQAHVYSPHLVHPAQTTDFAKEIVEVSTDATL
jgi:hypothetical protein